MSDYQHPLFKKVGDLGGRKGLTTSKSGKQVTDEGARAGLKIGSGTAKPVQGKLAIPKEPRKPKEIEAHWVEKDDATEHRPASWRLSGSSFAIGTVSVRANITQGREGSKYASDPGSVPISATTSTQAFNKEVGWRVTSWHWAVVANKTNSGDIDTLSEAKSKAEEQVRNNLGKSKRLVVS